MASLKESEKDAEILTTWAKKWDVCPRWHEQKVNIYLEKHFDRVRSIKAKDEEFKVFVPLCGKSLDLKWLLDKGCRVVGVDGVEKAIKEFFREHKLSFTVTPLQNHDSLYQCNERPLSIYHCNLFEFSKYNSEKYDLVWDRGSFVAVNYEQRQRYATLMKSLYAGKFHHLLESYFYESATFNDNPRKLPLQEVKELLGGELAYEHLDSEDRKERFESSFGHLFQHATLLIFIISSP